MQARLEEKWSPEQISVMLEREFPDDPGMRVSHETIYQSIYVLNRGALRLALAAQCQPTLIFHSSVVGPTML